MKHYSTRIFLVLLCVLGLNSCSKREVTAKPTATPVLDSAVSTSSAQWAVSSGASDLQLNANELDEYSKRALQGDIRSANRIAAYYEIWVGDHQAGRHWLQIAAENGDISAMLALADRVYEIGGQDCLRSVFWLEKAHQQALESHEEYISDIEITLARFKSGMGECLSRQSNKDAKN